LKKKYFNKEERNLAKSTRLKNDRKINPEKYHMYDKSRNNEKRKIWKNNHRKNNLERYRLREKIYREKHKDIINLQRRIRHKDPIYAEARRKRNRNWWNKNRERMAD